MSTLAYLFVWTADAVFGCVLIGGFLLYLVGGAIYFYVRGIINRFTKK